MNGFIKFHIQALGFMIIFIIALTPSVLSVYLIWLYSDAVFILILFFIVPALYVSRELVNKGIID